MFQRQRRPSISTVISELRDKRLHSISEGKPDANKQPHQVSEPGRLFSVSRPVPNSAENRFANPHRRRSSTEDFHTNSQSPKTPQPADIKSLSQVSVMISIQSPSFCSPRATSSGHNGARKNSVSAEESASDIKTTVTLSPKTSAAQVITNLIRETFGLQYVREFLGDSDVAILDRFGLFEAEYIYDEDEDMSLFSSDEQRIQNASATDLSLIEKRSISRRRDSTKYASRRRCNRVLAIDERPLFVLNNWKFYRSRPRTTASHSAPSERQFTFLIREMTEHERNFACYSSIRGPVSIDMDANQRYFSLPVDRLHKRRQIIDREELRTIQEAKERYEKQKQWIINAFTMY